jgi:NADH-quinone oxidoreductase subunit N
LPEVYDGSPFIVTFFYMILPKLVLFFILMKLYIIFSPFFFYSLYYLFLIIAILTLIFGFSLSIYQFKIKKFLAVSSILHTGFLLLAITLGSVEALYAFFVYYIIYVIILLGIFIIILNFRYNGSLKLITDLSELFILPK